MNSGLEALISDATSLITSFFLLGLGEGPALVATEAAASTLPALAELLFIGLIDLAAAAIASP